jgi:Holliday junction resolvasome RuvABC endonuclease subunit
MSLNIPSFFEKGKNTILFIDPSASHLAYCMADLDLDAKKMDIIATGMLWTKGTWQRGKRYKYMQNCINLLFTGYVNILPKAVVTEGFFINPKQMFGASVIPTVNAFIEMAADTNKAKYLEIGPPSWRSILGIKAQKTAENKRDYKTPTANLVKHRLGEIPSKMPSNLDKKERKTPNDVTDVLAIALAYAQSQGVNKVRTCGNYTMPTELLRLFQLESAKI